MTLLEKYKTLTPEQRQAFSTIKTALELDDFLAKSNITLSDEEKAQAVEYFDKGTLPLSDDDLESVAGGSGKGGGGGGCISCGSHNIREQFLYELSPDIFFEVICNDCGHREKRVDRGQS